VPTNPAAFPPAHWAALLAEGAVIEIKPEALTQDIQPKEDAPKKVTAVTKPARKTKAVKDA
jgi:hypothetical protein